MRANRFLLILGILALLYVGLEMLGPSPLSPTLSPPPSEFIRVAALVFIIVGAAWLSLKMFSVLTRRRARRENRPAEQILRERYARGELDRAQLGQMLDDLRGGLSPNL